MKEIAKEIEMRAVTEFKKIKEQIQDNLKVAGANDCPPEVTKAIEEITNKMRQCKLTELHPPFLPKTITKFRHEYFLPLKKELHPKINSSNESQFKEGINTLYQLIINLDSEYFDLYLQQIREPYIRKIFNENYQFDKIDFKQINTQYKIRSEIQNLLTNASEWLIQIEKTQDLLERIELYFDIKTPMVIEKIKKEGIQTKKDRTWAESISSMFRNITSFTLRKSSNIIQSSFFTALAPAAVMLTLAIIGGSASLPFQTDINGKLLMAPIAAIVIPYALDNLASTIQRKQYIQMLEQWAVSLEKVGSNIAKYNQELQEVILNCSSSTNIQNYNKQKLNLQKYVKVLEESMKNMTNFNEEYFEEMRERTEAYFKKYVQIQEGQWTIVIPSEEYELLEDDEKGKLTKIG